jgi:hypothetical protein
MGGGSSKSTFTDIINGLLSKEIDSAEHEFWDELWKTGLSGDAFLISFIVRN